MANKRIDQLNENLNPLTGSELIPIFDLLNNTTERITLTTLSNYIDQTGDTYITGGTFNSITGVLSLDLNDGTNVNVSGITSTYKFSTSDPTAIEPLLGNNTIYLGSSNSNFSNIGGGYSNVIGGSPLSSIGSGYGNVISGSPLSSIGGGYSNNINNGTYNTINGGYGNQMNDSGYSVILDGFNNRIDNAGFVASILGGYSNTINKSDGFYNSNWNSIQGGALNKIYTSNGINLFPDINGGNVIGGGSSNYIYGNTAKQTSKNNILNGFYNKISGSTSSMIGNGYKNEILSLNHYSIIGNGIQNKITDGYNITSVPLLPNFPNIKPTGALSNVIGGGSSNTIKGTVRDFLNGNEYVNPYSRPTDGRFNTIGGGYRNYVFGQYNTIAGGGRIKTGSGFPGNYFEGGNVISGNSSTISGGIGHVIKGRYSTIGGGGFYDFKQSTLGNTIIGNMSVIAGGFYNKIDTSPWYGGYGFNPGNSISAILGGSGNKINDGRFSWSTIGGGAYNYVRTGGSFIGGGGSNRIGYGLTPTQFPNDGYRSTIVGGYDNAVYSDYSNILGGSGNKISSEHKYSNIVGGLNNELSDNGGWGYNSIVGGGSNKVNYGGYNFIGGGSENEINGSYTVINGGDYNRILNYSYYSSIGGGLGNTISQYSISVTIGGGQGNSVIGEYSSIVGGQGNIINDSQGNGWSIIGGGFENIIVSTGSSKWVNGILSGGRNIINNSKYSTIGGGAYNQINGDYIVINGGYGNQITGYGYYSTIGGGFGNYVTQNSRSATIGGGANNIISDYSYYSTMAGGRSNWIFNSNYSFIGGGVSNVINTQSNNSAILGGNNNTILSGSNNTFIIGSNITSVSANTTHVNRLNIKTVTTGSTSSEVLVRETDGSINTKTLIDPEIVLTTKITTSVVTSATSFSNSSYTVTFPSSGTYMIEGFVKVKSSLTTVGFALSLSDTTNNNRRTELMLYGSNTATAASTDTNFFSYCIGNTLVTNNPTTGVLSTVNGNYSFGDVKGFITVSTSTTMAIQLRAETTGTVELESPSYLKFTKI